MKNTQTKLFKSSEKSYGGELLKTRKGRSTPRPLDTKSTMHLVLRSSKARGAWSFKHKNNSAKIKDIIEKFSEKYAVKVVSLANVGNHLHFQIKLSSRHTYKPFIRAISSAIAMAVTNANRWSNVRLNGKFWDYRPFSRIVQSYRAYLNLRDYIQVNQLEGYGYRRDEARFILAKTSLRLC